MIPNSRTNQSRIVNLAFVRGVDFQARRFLREIAVIGYEIATPDLPRRPLHSVHGTDDGLQRCIGAVRGLASIRDGIDYQNVTTAEHALRFKVSLAPAW